MDGQNGMSDSVQWVSSEITDRLTTRRSFGPYRTVAVYEEEEEDDDSVDMMEKDEESEGDRGEGEGGDGGWRRNGDQLHSAPWSGPTRLLPTTQTDTHHIHTGLQPMASLDLHLLALRRLLLSMLPLLLTRLVELDVDRELRERLARRHREQQRQLGIGRDRDVVGRVVDPRELSSRQQLDGNDPVDVDRSKSGLSRGEGILRRGLVERRRWNAHQSCELSCWHALADKLAGSELGSCDAEGLDGLGTSGGGKCARRPVRHLSRARQRKSQTYQRMRIS